MKRVKTILPLLLIICISFTATAQKAEYFTSNGNALKGYDVVAFHSQKKAVEGVDSLFYNWKNTQWLFSTRANMDSFKLDPMKYAPQFGGYCAFGISEGHKAPVEINTWTVINNKLYFNYNKKVQSLWNKEQDSRIVKAEALWEGIKDQE